MALFADTKRISPATTSTMPLSIPGLSKKARRADSLLRNASSACLRAVMSVIVTTVPSSFRSKSSIWAVLNSNSTRKPFGWIRNASIPRTNGAADARGSSDNAASWLSRRRGNATSKGCNIVLTALSRSAAQVARITCPDRVTNHDSILRLIEDRGGKDL